MREIRALHGGTSYAIPVAFSTRSQRFEAVTEKEEEEKGSRDEKMEKRKKEREGKEKKRRKEVSAYEKGRLLIYPT